jgi:DNA-binding GntR family transcriptional regulator
MGPWSLLWLGVESGTSSTKFTLYMSDGNLAADISDRPLYAFLEEECSLFIAHGRRFIEAVLANETEARLLEIDIGALLL